MNPLLNFVTALPSEARPLIDHYGLTRRDTGHGLAYYESAQIRLAVSGVGKAASAYAVGVLAGLASVNASQVWINVGIAGHRDAALGTIGIAHRIDDVATNRAHYPAITFASRCPGFRVACFDHPTTSYDGDALCDMESAAFFDAAARCSGIESAQVLKVVSDNSADHLAALDRETISELIRGQISRISEVAECLLGVIRSTAPRPAPARAARDLEERWRFSATQSLQLRELERRWALLRGGEAWPPDVLAGCRSARDAIERLQSAVDAEMLELDSR